MYFRLLETEQSIKSTVEGHDTFPRGRYPWYFSVVIRDLNS